VFQVAFPGVGGGAPHPVFQIANVNDSPTVAIRADVLADGTISAKKMVTGTITAISAIIADAAIENAKIANAAITTAKIGDLQVDTFKIAGNAITAPAVAIDNSVYSTNNSSGYTQIIAVSSTVTLESGYTYWAVVNGFVDFTRGGLGFVQMVLTINSGSIVQTSKLDVVCPAVFVYAVPQTGSGGSQTISAQLHVVTNGQTFNLEHRYIDITIMKR
jgi:hypothetical protein